MDDIKTDEDLVQVIDELKHRLKAGIPYSPMKAEFNAVLNAFIRKWRLDTDPHAFATLPADYKETVNVTGRFSSGPNLNNDAFPDDLLDWLIAQPWEHASTSSRRSQSAEPNASNLPKEEKIILGQNSNCCDRMGQYNGFHTGAHLFECPKKCPCHD